MGRFENITKEQLIEFSGEHLSYEIGMLYGVVELLNNREKLENPYIINSLIESFVIHTQVILDFFYIPQMKADDAKAIHYINDIPKWKKAIPSYDRYFRKFNRRRSREVVHLSYRRLEVKGDDKTWQLFKTTEHIKIVVNAFLDHANPELIHPNLYELRRDISDDVLKNPDD